MIEIINLSKSYGQIQAVKNLNFTVNKGEIVGFLGPNGAGKTTTMNIITGYLPSTEGTVKVCGYDILENPAEVKKLIGYMPDIPPLYMEMTVKDYLYFVSSLKRTPKEKRQEQLTRVMEQVKITHMQGRLVKNLSKGYKQRVGLAQALMGSPEVLVLDEPTAGLDPTQIIEMRKLIKQLGKEHTIILSSHILPDVCAVCDRIVIINKGEIAAIDTPANLSRIFAHSAKFTVRIAGPKATVKNLISGLAGVSQVTERTSVDQHSTDFLVETTSDTDVRRPLFFEMAKNGYPILELRSISMSLEDVFLQVITDEKEVSAQ